MTKLKSYGREAINTVLERVGRGISHVQERKPLDADLLETDEEYLLVFDAPGATKEDIQVRFVDNQVEVRIDRFRPFYEEFEMRFPGRGLTLSGTAELPPSATLTDSQTTPKATLTQVGTLHVRIPKAQQTSSVTVEDEEDEEPEEESDGDSVDVDDAESTDDEETS